MSSISLAIVQTGYTPFAQEGTPEIIYSCSGDFGEEASVIDAGGRISMQVVTREGDHLMLSKRNSLVFIGGISSAFIEVADSACNISPKSARNKLAKLPGATIERRLFDGQWMLAHGG